MIKIGIVELFESDHSWVGRDNIHQLVGGGLSALGLKAFWPNN